MDSGSMTNWLAKGLLDKLNHTVKGHTSLEVYTLTGSTIKKFKLVEIYYYYNGQTHRHTDTQTHRHTYTQTHIHTHRHT